MSWSPALAAVIRTAAHGNVRVCVIDHVTDSVHLFELLHLLPGLRLSEREHAQAALRHRSADHSGRDDCRKRNAARATHHMHAERSLSQPARWWADLPPFQFPLFPALPAWRPPRRSVAMQLSAPQRTLHLRACECVL